ncbi:MAG: glycosyltransferase family 4 protein [Phycisphaerae bacterium]|jgi:glycosyltransferase involved in cell wall biosynthesis|nr:glycosyltransferase family 4 protein [Phycisphaerae bacterium]MCZ2399255.1 glycosyltransferase family 4 protein [Phycisphaerae bacterium]
MPLRVALFSWESLHSIPVGGLAVHVSELATALCRCGHEIHVFTRRGPDQPRYDCIDGVHYHRCDLVPHTDFLTYIERMCHSFVERLVEAERLYSRPFDVIHGHDWLCAVALRRIKNELRRPVILTMHATEYGRCGNQLCNGQSARIREIEWEGTYVADRVICVSGALRDEVAWLYSLPADRSLVIHNGVDVHRFDDHVSRKTVRERYCVSSKSRIVLFVGRLAWQKGPDLLLESVPAVRQACPTVTFVFVGDGDMRAALDDRANAMQLNGSVRFLGSRAGHELVSLFKAADVVCVPSRNEPFGIVVLEAWSASRPVVVTRNGGPREFVADRKNGTLVHDNPESISDGLRSILGDEQGARRMGRHGRRLVESRFSWGRVAAQTLDVYASVG